MRLDEARKIAVEEMKKHHLLGWSFGFDNAKKRGGCCYWSQKKITLSHHFVLLNPESVVRNTILHEVAHAVAQLRFGPGARGHGPLWVGVAKELGCSGERCLSEDVVRTEGRYVGTCSDCGYSTERHKALAPEKINTYYHAPCRKRGLNGRVVWKQRW